MPPRTRLLYLLTPPALLTYTTHRTLTDLEHKYPAIPPSQGSTAALTTPTNPSTQRCAEIDIYQARVPVRALLRAEAAITASAAITENLPTDNTTPPNVSPATLQKAWAHLFLTSPILQTEAKLIGLCTQGTFHPGDVGLSAGGFAPVAADGDNQNNNDADADTTTPPATTAATTNNPNNLEGRAGHKRQLINGGFTVERTPEHPGGLLASWRVPDGARRFFESLAHWGYPCRLMSGGRHEWGVSEVYFVNSKGNGEGQGQGEWVVDVRFGSAHDYEVVAAEGERQKVVPRWVGRLHRGYARMLVEDAVRRLERYD